MIRTLPRAGSSRSPCSPPPPSLLASCGSDGKARTDVEHRRQLTAAATRDVGASGCGTPAGEVSDSVKVTGDFGKTQTATFSTPLDGDGLERTVARPRATGATTADGQTVDTLISVYLGKDGKALGSEPVSLTVGRRLDDQGVHRRHRLRADRLARRRDGAGQGHVRRPGQPPARDHRAGHPRHRHRRHRPEEAARPAGLEGRRPEGHLRRPGQAHPEAAEGQARPTCSSRCSARATATSSRPATASPSTTRAPAGTPGRSSTRATASSRRPSRTDQVVEGFGAALVGQKVGTRLVVTIPPKYAYGEKGAGSELSGQTLVFVIEIKKTAAAAAVARCGLAAGVIGARRRWAASARRRHRRTGR